MGRTVNQSMGRTDNVKNRTRRRRASGFNQKLWGGKNVDEEKMGSGKQKRGEKQNGVRNKKAGADARARNCYD